MMEEGHTRLQFVAAFTATFAYLIGGTFLGWTSPVLPKLMGKDSQVTVNSDQSAWIAAFMPFGMLFAPIPTGYIVDYLGRKTVLASTSIPFIVSWLMIIFASTAEELYASRFLGGLGLGVAFTVGPMYMGEIAEDRIRGAVSTLFQVMINIGTLFEFCVGPYIPYVSLGISSAIFPIVFLATFIWMPESPYYLLARNRRGDAEKSLLKLRGKTKPENVKDELEMMQMTVEMQSKDKGSITDLIRIRGNRKALFIVLGLMAIQHFSGIVPLLSFATTVFLKSGSSIDANISVIILGVVQFIVSISSSLLVDRVGRKPLLLASSVGCFVSLAVEGFYFFYEDALDSDWMPVTFMIMYIVTYTLGLGPLPWAVAGEVFPNNVKALAMSLVSIANALFALLFVKLFQVISDAQGVYVPFWMFSACCMIGTLFIAICLPETKGKSLLEINEVLNNVNITKVKDVNTKENGILHPSVFPH